MKKATSVTAILYHTHIPSFCRRSVRWSLVSSHMVYWRDICLFCVSVGQKRKGRQKNTINNKYSAITHTMRRKEAAADINRLTTEKMSLLSLLFFLPILVCYLILHTFYLMHHRSHVRSSAHAITHFLSYARLLLRLFLISSHLLTADLSTDQPTNRPTATQHFYFLIWSSVFLPIFSEILARHSFMHSTIVCFDSIVHHTMVRSRSLHLFWQLVVGHSLSHDAFLLVWMMCCCFFLGCNRTAVVEILTERE